MTRSFVARFIVALPVALASLSSPSAAPRPVWAEEEQPSEADLKQQREARLRDMLEQAKTVTVESQAASGSKLAALHVEPLFRYADALRKILDATLWCWGDKGRPVALTKLEMVAARRNLAAEWQYCIASLSEQPIAVTWPDDPQFATTKAGTEFRSISNAPEPEAKPAGRLRQMKDLVKRFSATILIDGKPELKQEMRQLASPIHRYSDADSGLADGAVFGFSTNGTNPDVLLLIEASSLDKQPGWRFAVVGMTWAEFRVRLDEAEVYRMPFPPLQDTWTIRHIPRSE